MRHTLEQATLEIAMKHSPTTLLVFDHAPLSTIKAWAKRFGRHGFRFHKVLPEENKTGDWNADLEAPITMLYLAGMDNESNRRAYELKSNPFNLSGYWWIAVSFDPQLVSFPMIPVLSRGVTKRKQEPTMSVTFQANNYELERLGDARLPGESRGATCRRLLAYIIDPYRPGIPAPPGFNLPVSTPPEKA